MSSGLCTKHAASELGQMHSIYWVNPEEAPSVVSSPLEEPQKVEVAELLCCVPNAGWPLR